MGLQVFFIEFWPVLVSTCSVLTSYIQDGRQGALLPGKSFGPDSAAQHGNGRLTHTFSLPFGAKGKPGGVSHGRRYVNPYHIWMLQRVDAAMKESDTEMLRAFLEQIDNGIELFQLPALLRGCRVRKDGGLIYADSPPASRL